MSLLNSNGAISLQICPVCGSADVEDLQYVKVNPVPRHKTYTEGEDDDPKYWCPKCEDHPDELKEELFIPSTMLLYHLLEINKELTDTQYIIIQSNLRAAVKSLEKIKLNLSELIRADKNWNQSAQ